MAFAIIDAMTDGFERTVQRNGLLLVAVFAVLAIVNTLLAPTVGPAGTTEPIGGLVGLITGLLSLVVALVSVIAVIVALRTFASNETEQVPPEFVRRNIGLTTLNVIVGAIAFTALVAIGSVFFVIPGLFVLVSLYYWSVFVAVEDQNFVQAFRSSWDLTRGSRFRLFGLGVAVFGVLVVVTAGAAIPAVFFGTAGALITQVVGAVLTVYALATTVSAYEQLRSLERLEQPNTKPDMPGTPV